MFHTSAKPSVGIYPKSAAAALSHVPAKQTPLLYYHILFYLKQSSQIVRGRRGDVPPCEDECVCIGDGNDDDRFWPWTGFHMPPQIFSE